MSRGQSPPSETNGAQNQGSVTPAEQNATSTSPSSMTSQGTPASGQNDSESTKIVKSSPGV